MVRVLPLSGRQPFAVAEPHRPQEFDFRQHGAGRRDGNAWSCFRNRSLAIPRQTGQREFINGDGKHNVMLLEVKAACFGILIDKRVRINSSAIFLKFIVPNPYHLEDKTWRRWYLLSRYMLKSLPVFLWKLRSDWLGWSITTRKTSVAKLSLLSIN